MPVLRIANVLVEPARPTLWLRGAGRFQVGPEYAGRFDAQPLHHLFYTVAGAGRYRWHGTVGTDSARRLSSVPASTRGSSWEPAGRRWDFYYVAFVGDGFAAWLAQLGFTGPRLALPVATGRDAELRERFEALIAALRVTTAAGQPALQAQALALVAALIEAASPPSPPARRPAPGDDELVAHLDDYLRRPDPAPDRVADLARRVGWSVRRVEQRIKARTGLAPKRYLLLARMDQARRLLRETSLPIQAVAAQVGFPDAFHFSKQFHRLVGMPPQRWRTRRDG